MKKIIISSMFLLAVTSTSFVFSLKASDTEFNSIESATSDSSGNYSINLGDTTVTGLATPGAEVVVKY